MTQPDSYIQTGTGGITFAGPDRRGAIPRRRPRLRPAADLKVWCDAMKAALPVVEG